MVIRVSVSNRELAACLEKFFQQPRAVQYQSPVWRVLRASGRLKGLPRGKDIRLVKEEMRGDNYGY